MNAHIWLYLVKSDQYLAIWSFLGDSGDDLCLQNYVVSLIKLFSNIFGCLFDVDTIVITCKHEMEHVTPSFRGEPQSMIIFLSK